MIKNFLSIVVYIRNNEKDLYEFLPKIDSFFNENVDSYEFVLVNDASVDNSRQVINEISKSIQGALTVIDLDYTHGKEKAMLAGIEYAIGDFVFEFDYLTINYDLKEIFTVYEKSLEGYDIVGATPNSKTAFSSRLFYKLLNKFSYKRMTIVTEAFRIISRRAINRVFSFKNNFLYRKALYYYYGFDTFSYKYEVVNNLAIKNNISLNEKFKLAIDVLFNFSDIGIKVSLKISQVFLLISITTCAYTIYMYLVNKNIQLGWTTTMLFLSVSFCGLFFVLYLLSIHMTIIMNEISKKPSYIYKKISKISKRGI